MKTKNNKATIKTAEEHYTALIESYEKAAKESASAAAEASIKAEGHATNAECEAVAARKAATDAKYHVNNAEAACRGAAANAEYARVQANGAENAAEEAKRYYLTTKAFTEDSLEHRKRAAKSALDARHEACSAMYCVIWCVIGTAISIAACIFSIYH